MFWTKWAAFLLKALASMCWNSGVLGTAVPGELPGAEKHRSCEQKDLARMWVVVLPSGGAGRMSMVVPISEVPYVISPLCTLVCFVALCSSVWLKRRVCS